jgi:hypothetical protein
MVRFLKGFLPWLNNTPLIISAQKDGKLWN